MLAQLPGCKEVEMPQFSPGEIKKALVTMSNLTGSPFDYSVTLYMGVNMVTMASAIFHLEANETKDVEISPVIMPVDAGTFPVYLDVWSNGNLLGHYKAVEDVVITGLAPPPGNGLLWGFVHDSVTREALPDVQIVLNGLVHNTSSQGAYEIRNIACQQYQVQFSKGGFVTETYNVDVTTDTRLNVGLLPLAPTTQPSLIYASPVTASAPRGGSVTIDYQIIVPNIPALVKIDLYFYLEGFRTETIGGHVEFAGGTPAGTYTGSRSISLKRFIWGVGYVDYPTGTYRLFSRCLLRHDSSVYITYWQDVDTGKTITVV